MNKKQKRNWIILIIVLLLLLLFKSCQRDESLKDSDGDGFIDKEESKAGTSPTDSSDFPGVMEPLPEGTYAVYTSENCLTECQARGYDTGACGFSEGIVSLGLCTVPGTICSAGAGCFCSCKNIEEINPLDVFTCGNAGDPECGGTCPDSHPKCLRKEYGEDYYACVCYGEFGINENWDVGGERHFPR